MTNLGISPEASMPEKADRCRYHAGKEADESGECDTLLIPSHTKNKGASAIFTINWR
jgi:hypothetical protein